MEIVGSSYSLRNIYISRKTVYLENMIFTLESFINGIRSKVFTYKKLVDISEIIADNFVFKSVRTPQKNEHLNALKDDCSIKFIVVSSKFQSNLSNRH